MALIQLELTLARSFESPFVVSGSLAPEHFLVKDLRTGETWHIAPDPESESSPLTVYSLLARRMGVYISVSGENVPVHTENVVESTIENAVQTSTDTTGPQVNPESNSPQNEHNWPKNVLLFTLTRP